MSEIESLIKDIVSQLQSRTETLSLAESCTGGLFSAHLTNLAGVSSVYSGTVVSYANSVKEEIIDVPHDLLLRHGAVSKEVALAMARGVRIRLRTTWSVAITGIAGPTGGTPDKPVGTICFAVVGPSFEEAETQLFKGDRSAIRLASVKYGAYLLNRALGAGSKR